MNAADGEKQEVKHQIYNFHSFYQNLQFGWQPPPPPQQQVSITNANVLREKLSLSMPSISSSE